MRSSTRDAPPSLEPGPPPGAHQPETPLPVARLLDPRPLVRCPPLRPLGTRRRNLPRERCASVSKTPRLPAPTPRLDLHLRPSTVPRVPRRRHRSPPRRLAPPRGVRLRDRPPRGCTGNCRPLRLWRTVTASVWRTNTVPSTVPAAPTDRSCRYDSLLACARAGVVAEVRTMVTESVTGTWTSHSGASHLSSLGFAEPAPTRLTGPVRRDVVRISHIDSGAVSDDHLIVQAHGAIGLLRFDPLASSAGELARFDTAWLVFLASHPPRRSITTAVDLGASGGALALCSPS